MLSTAKSANVGFRLVVQLLAPPTNRATHLAQKIPVINSEKNIMVSTILGFSMVRVRLKVTTVRDRVRHGLGLALALGSV